MLAYAYEEAFGEKVRALGERTRPRDLYDVINLYRNHDARPDASVVLDVLRRKCAYKGINIPDLAVLEPHLPALRGSWADMLEHQLPALPPLESFWAELSNFFSWLMNGAAPRRPDAYGLAAGERVLRERTFVLPVLQASHSFIEIIRFAATNRLVVEIDYNPERGEPGVRRIEPYSLRQTRNGDVVLHAINVEKGQHRCYRVDRIRGAHATSTTFVPTYDVELTPHGPLSVPHIERGPRNFARRGGRSRSPYLARPTSGPVYVFECSSCGKRFRRKKNNSAMNPHKDKDGYQCYGRHGYLVDTQY